MSSEAVSEPMDPFSISAVEIDGCRRYRCSRCGKTYSTRYNCRVHNEAIHIRNRTFACPVKGCNMSFFRQSNRLSHTANVHGRVRKKRGCQQPDNKPPSSGRRPKKVKPTRDEAKKAERILKTLPPLEVDPVIKKEPRRPKDTPDTQTRAIPFDLFDSDSSVDSNPLPLPSEVSNSFSEAVTMGNDVVSRIIGEVKSESYSRTSITKSIALEEEDLWKPLCWTGEVGLDSLLKSPPNQASPSHFEIDADEGLAQPIIPAAADIPSYAPGFFDFLSASAPSNISSVSNSFADFFQPPVDSAFTSPAEKIISTLLQTQFGTSCDEATIGSSLTQIMALHLLGDPLHPRQN